MAQVLDCTAVATAIKEKCRAESDALRAKGIVPKLGILRVGEKGPDLSYEKGATKAMNECNVEVQVVALPADVSQEEYIKTIRAMDADPTIHGILAFRPLDNIDETVAISQNLSAVKDVDSTTVENMGKVVIGDPTGLAPCTPQAIMAVIDHYAEEIKAHTRKKYAKLELAKPGQEDDVCCGLDVCVINNSNIIGKPLSMMLTNRYATVSIVHHLTHAEIKNDYIKRADVVIIATPFKGTLTADMIAEDCIVIDAGVVREKAFDENGQPIINEKTGKQKINTFGSAAADTEAKAAWKTPVPGVGGITSSILARNVITAAKIQNNLL